MVLIQLIQSGFNVFLGPQIGSKIDFKTHKKKQKKIVIFFTIFPI